MPLIVGAGPIATERALFRALDAALGANAQPPRNVLVVVSSGTLRRNILARYAAHRPGVHLGLRVLTLWTLAEEVLARAGVFLRTEGGLFAVLVRRAAGMEADLASELEVYEDGFGVVYGSVRDLLSAGFTPGMEDAALAALEESLPIARRTRPAAIVRIAARTALGLDALKLVRRDQMLTEASEQFRTRQSEVLGADDVFIHGFADATGRGAELIEALIERAGATMTVDWPPDPADSSVPSAGTAHVAAFLHRLGQRVPPKPEIVAEPPSIAALRTVGTGLEVHVVARRIRELLDSGILPERIGVVARDLDVYAPALRARFRELRIPGTGPRAALRLWPLHRRVQSALRLLSLGRNASVDLWFAAIGETIPAPLASVVDLDVATLRLLLGSLGVARLADAERDPLQRVPKDLERVVLPTRGGLDIEGVSFDAASAPRSQRRSVAAEDARSVLEYLAAVVRDIESFTLGRLDAARTWIEALLHQRLGFGDSNTATLAIAPGLEALGALADVPIELSKSEVSLVLGAALREAGSGDLFETRSGVQVLDFPRARGLDFDALFVLGVDQSTYPRAVPADALLDDAARAALAPILIHLHRGSEHEAEERYGFAQLLSAARQITLTMPVVDDNGKERTASPYVEPLLASGCIAAVTPAPTSRHAAIREDLLREAPVLARRDAVFLAALEGTRPTLARAFDGFGPTGFGGARVWALEHYDPDLATPEGRQAAHRSSPFLGFVGRRPKAASPPAVTTLERFARCGWETFLSKVLKVEPVPDPHRAQNGIDARLLGTLVHETLDAVLRAVAPKDAQGHPVFPAVIERPQTAVVDLAIRLATTKLAQAEGLYLVGLRKALEKRARVLVDLLLNHDFSVGSRTVVGVERQGRLQVNGQAITFRADRVDEVDGVLLFTDYKTGKIDALERKREATIALALRGLLAGGTHLQVAAYAFSKADGAEGRYLVAREEGDVKIYEGRMSASNTELRKLFSDVAEQLALGLSDGVFLPRVVDVADRKEPRACSSCELRDACVIGDSGARGRLERIYSQTSVPDLKGDPVTERGRYLWNLPLAARKKVVSPEVDS